MGARLAPHMHHLGVGLPAELRQCVLHSLLYAARTSAAVQAPSACCGRSPSRCLDWTGRRSGWQTTPLFLSWLSPPGGGSGRPSSFGDRQFWLGFGPDPGGNLFLILIVTSSTAGTRPAEVLWILFFRYRADVETATSLLRTHRKRRGAWIPPFPNGFWAGKEQLRSPNSTTFGPGPKHKIQRTSVLQGR